MSGIDLIHSLHEVWNTGNLELIDRVYAPDFLAHWPASSEVPERRGIEGIRFGVTRIRTAFPDWHERARCLCLGRQGCEPLCLDGHASGNVLGH
jgi:hypothetical protein